MSSVFDETQQDQFTSQPFAWAENRLKRCAEHLLTSLSVSTKNQPTEPPISRWTGHELSAANSSKKDLILKGSELKQHWLDGEHWKRLAKKRGYRLPHWYLPLTKRGMERVLRGLGLGRQFYRDNFGLRSYQDLIDRNPLTPLWVFAGWCLELTQSSKRRGEIDGSEDQ